MPRWKVCWVFKKSTCCLFVDVSVCKHLFALHVCVVHPSVVKSDFHPSSCNNTLCCYLMLHQIKVNKQYLAFWIKHIWVIFWNHFAEKTCVWQHRTCSEDCYVCLRHVSLININTIIPTKTNNAKHTFAFNNWCYFWWRTKNRWIEHSVSTFFDLFGYVSLNIS